MNQVKKGKCAPYGLLRLKENLFKIIAFPSKTPKERVTCFKTKIRKEGERKELLRMAKVDYHKKHTSGQPVALTSQVIRRKNSTVLW